MAGYSIVTPIRSKKKNPKPPSRGFSLYSSDSEDPVVVTHKGLDRCASLLAHIMESPLPDGDRGHEGRSMLRGTRGIKSKPKKKLKKRSSKDERSKVKAQNKEDKKVAAREDRKNQPPGQKKSKSSHHQLVFQPGLVSSTPQKEVRRGEKQKQGLNTEEGVQAQAIQQNYNQVKGQAHSPLGRVIHLSRFDNAGYYEDQMIPERDTCKENRPVQQDLKGQNESRKTENSRRLDVADETEQRCMQNLIGGFSTVGGYHGFKDEHVPAQVERGIPSENFNRTNEPRDNMQHGLQWSTGERQLPPGLCIGKRNDNFIYSNTHKGTPKETLHGLPVHSDDMGLQTCVDGSSGTFIPPSVTAADENLVARNVLRDLVNTLKSINEKEAASLCTNPVAGNQTASVVRMTADGDMKGWVGKCDSQTLGEKERLEVVDVNAKEVREQPPVNTAGQNFNQQRSQSAEKCQDNLLMEPPDSHRTNDRQVISIEKYPGGYAEKEDSKAVKDFELERKLKGDALNQEMKNDLLRNAQISPETCISRENYLQVNGETIPGERDKVKSPEMKKKKRKYQSASAGAKSKTKRALWEQQRVLKCLVMELKAVTEQKENLEVQRLFGEILETLETLPYLTMDSDVQTEIAMGLQPLRSENAQLRRKLRISNQQMREAQKAEQQQQSFEVIALKTLNTTLQGQLEAEQKESVALKEKVEGLTLEMETMHKKCEELTQMVNFKDESHLRSQREWITEMASLRKEQTCSKQELETTKLTLDSLRRENTFLLKSLEESKKMLQEFEEECRTRISPHRKRSWECGASENMPKVTREANRRTRFDLEEASNSETTVNTNGDGDEKSRDKFSSSHRSRSEKNPPFSQSAKGNLSNYETRTIPSLREMRQYNYDRILEGGFAMGKYFPGDLGNWNLQPNREEENKHEQDESILPAVSLIQTSSSRVKGGSDEKLKSNQNRKEAENVSHLASHNALQDKPELQDATLISESENVEKLKGCDVYVGNDEQNYFWQHSYSLKYQDKQGSSSMPLALSQGPSVPHPVLPGPHQGATSPYHGGLLKPSEVSVPVDQSSCISESTASSITSLFEAQFQLGLSTLDDKIAKLQENLKFFKGNKNT